MARHRVIIPTYNEVENIPELVRAIRAVDPTIEILVVDDNSPDNTAQIAGELGCHVLVRKANKGLSASVVDGIMESLDCDSLVVMDADLQHPPEALPEMFSLLEQCDIVVGQRKLNRKQWPLHRQIVSTVANVLAYPYAPRVKDRMTGFFGIKPVVVNPTSLNPVGYKIGLEILARGKYDSIGVVEYNFKLRKHGKSKLTGRVVREYLKQIWILPMFKHHNFTLSKFTKFALVGGTGTLIHWASVYFMTEFIGFWYMLSVVLGSFITVTWNFTMNALWTFRR